MCRRDKVKQRRGKIFRHFEKGYHAIALQMGASHMKDRGFDMYGTSREMFGLQVDCVVTSSIVVDFFHSLHASIHDMSSNLDAFLVILVFLNILLHLQTVKKS